MVGVGRHYRAGLGSRWGELGEGLVSMLGGWAGVFMVIWCACVCSSPIVQGRGWRIWKNPHIRSMSVLLKGWKGLEPCFLLQGVGVGEVLASLDRDLSRSLPWLAEFWVLHSFDSLWAALNSLQDTWIVPCGWGHGPDQVSWWQVEEHHERRF